MSSDSSIPPLVACEDAVETGHALSVAPMLDVSNVHFFTALRLLTKRAVLYSEMVHCNTIVYANKEGRLDPILAHEPTHEPLILQLGGADPTYLAEATRIVTAKYPGYKEFNLNCGCPSRKVVRSEFGARLMKEPSKVIAALNAIRSATHLPVTIKCRLGVDNLDTYEFIHGFVQAVHEGTGVDHFIIHARKAFLKGLDPKANRTVPPLRYHDVFRLIDDFPGIRFSLNGGVKTMLQARALMQQRGQSGRGLYGCMIGRTAYENVWEFAECDRQMFGVPNPDINRLEFLLRYADYVDRWSGGKLDFSVTLLSKPILTTINGLSGATAFRSKLSSRDSLISAGSYRNLMLEAIGEIEKINPNWLADSIAQSSTPSSSASSSASSSSASSVSP